VIAARLPQFGIIGPGIEPGPDFYAQLDPRKLILKNVGKGPALAVVIFHPDDAALVGGIQVVMPLGDGIDEAHRIGRVTLSLQRPIASGEDYELYCQDSLGGWHLTRFRPGKHTIDCQFSRPVTKVPPEVEAQGRVAAF
jgi:hypothetical protein